LPLLTNKSRNELDHLILLTTRQGYTFDLAGNVITDAQGRTFNYDAENKQKSVSNSGGSLGTYFYDGDGKRVKKVSNLETTIFVYDAAGKLVAEYSNQISPMPQVSYLTSDALGTPRINTDANGTVIARHDYMRKLPQASAAEIRHRNTVTVTVPDRNLPGSNAMKNQSSIILTRGITLLH